MVLMNLPLAVVKNLQDRAYDKRKSGALEIESMVFSFQNKDTGVEKMKVFTLIETLSDDFIKSSQPNTRKGGLIALCAVAVGLGKETREFLQSLLPPVISCLEDTDSRVRYYACESLFNIAKVSRGDILVFFNEIFDGLCKLFSDVDMDVRNGALMLDRLIKEIITETVTFNVEKFIPLLQKYINLPSAYVRRLLITWIAILDSVPEIDMLDWLPEYLEGLFSMLSDGNTVIRQEADQMLCVLIKEIRDINRIGDLDLAEVIDILVRQCTCNHNFTRLSAVLWVNTFIEIGGQKLIKYYAELLGTVLKLISDAEDEVRIAASLANDNLLLLVKSTPTDFTSQHLVSKITLELVNTHVPTRIASLKWISILLLKTPEEMTGFIKEIYPALLKTLSDDSDIVVMLDLEVLVRTAVNETQFLYILESMVALFREDRNLLEQRGSLIIRKLCVHLNSIKVYRALSKMLSFERDVYFASLMIQALNLILLTAVELGGLRKLLKMSFNKPSDSQKEAFTVFFELYVSFCNNPVAAFSLCLLAQAYEASAALVLKFSQLEISQSFLMQIDKLIQLIESPIFLHIRIQLLEQESEKLPDLLKSLYGLLAILPQTDAYKNLRDRLNRISNLHQVSLKIILKNKPVIIKTKIVENNKLVEHFLTLQLKHQLE